MTTEEILAKAARRECLDPECNQGIFPSAMGADAHPACDGTGLWLPELSEECPCRCHRQGRASLALSCCTHLDTDLDKLIVGSRLDCFDDRDQLDAAAERLEYPISLRIADAPAVHGYFKGTEDIYREMGHYGFGPEAQQAALCEVIKCVWPEVEDE